MCDSLIDEFRPGVGRDAQKNSLNKVAKLLVLDIFVI
jgi:hypothetical protein